MLKNIFKDKKLYIAASIMVVIGLIPFIVAMILALIPSSTSSFMGYPYATWAIFVLYFFIGYIWGDIHIARARHSLKQYDGKLSDEIRLAAWKRRMPFFLAATVLFILAMALELSHLILGFYVFA